MVVQDQDRPAGEWNIATRMMIIIAHAEAQEMLCTCSSYRYCSIDAVFLELISGRCVTSTNGAN
jgi:hypothetical protein